MYFRFHYISGAMLNICMCVDFSCVLRKVPVRLTPSECEVIRRNLNKNVVPSEWRAIRQQQQQQ